VNSGTPVDPQNIDFGAFGRSGWTPKGLRRLKSSSARPIHNRALPDGPNAAAGGRIARRQPVDPGEVATES
jgi:hypothetical protein